MSRILIFAVATLVAVQGANVHMGRGFVGKERERSLLQTFNRELAGSKNGKVTPVTRVVNLLKEMAATLNKEMEEDENQYHELACWCNDNVYEKKLAAEENKEKEATLTADIERLTAKSKTLGEKIAQLEAEVAADKKALAEATAVREKELAEFHKMEVEDIEALENLKAAIVVLAKHQDGNLPYWVKQEAEAAGYEKPDNFLQMKEVKDEDSPFGPNHESHMSWSFDEFLRKSDFDLSAQGFSKSSQTQSKFLQAETVATTKTTATELNGWSEKDSETLRRAVRSASSFLEAHHGHGYFPTYEAQSGEIFGVLKQLKEEMTKDLKEAQEIEAKRAASFAELRKAKTEEIESGEKMAEEKEDEKATTDNALAEAKEDLGVTEAALAEDAKFSANLEETCKEAEANFEKRKEARLAEIKNVAETIEILTQDEAQDAMDTTFSFVQMSTQDMKQRKLRQQAAAVLRRSKSPLLSLLATSVEMDAFTKVKEAIDKMIVQLKAEQADEVKKNDYCIESLQENEMETMKAKDLKADLEAQAESLENKIKTLSEEIEKAKNEVAALQTNLQRASENRKTENLEYQKTVADQMVTAEVLNKALQKLASFYDAAAFAQMHKGGRKQTPPVPQMEYKKSDGAGGVMGMIEKLIYDTKDITAKSKKSESEAQAAYEALIADTNESIEDLHAEIATKTKTRAETKKDLSSTKSDLDDTIQHLEDLGKTNADLHTECDYYMKNFNIRQQARAEEIEALQQAKQILSGAIAN